uniref:Uncharacterized protein n=1 Tax=Solanum lycopersicum TaxID=4081 RepID=A0A3Q7H4N2_SOLLC
YTMVTWCKSYRGWAHFSDDLPQSPLVISTLGFPFIFHQSSLPFASCSFSSSSVSSLRPGSE